MRHLHLRRTVTVSYTHLDVYKRQEYAECVDIGAMEFDKLVAFAKEKQIDLTVVGMDDPLVGGIVDAFEAEGLRVFGPKMCIRDRNRDDIWNPSYSTLRKEA